MPTKRTQPKKTHPTKRLQEGDGQRLPFYQCFQVKNTIVANHAKRIPELGIVRKRNPLKGSV